MALKTTVFDPPEYLETPESEAFFLSEGLATKDAAMLAHTLGTIARARGMTGLAREAGVSRESLYRILDEDGEAQLFSLTAVVMALQPALAVHPHARSID